MPFKFNPFTGELDLVSDADNFIGQIDADSGSATPTGGVINLLGGDGIITSAAGDTVTVSMITPVTVSNGGTGRTSATEYSVICGGTTSTSAHQSVASVGTTGQVLTSNGAAALPTWQDTGDVTAAANLDDFAVVCGDGGDKGVQTIASVGTTGQVLTSNGAGALPTFEDAAGGGGPLLKYWKASDLDALETNFAPLNQDDGSNASILVRSFDDTTEEFVNFSMSAPNAIDTSGTVTFRAYIYAETAAASVNVQLRLGHISANDNDSWDVAYSNEDSGDVALSATQDQITVAEWTETVTNLGWAADDLLLLRLSRISPTGTDLTGDLQLIGFSTEVPQ